MHHLAPRYNDCYQSNLNGMNLNARQVKAGISWWTWRGRQHSLRSAELAIVRESQTEGEEIAQLMLTQLCTVQYAICTDLFLMVVGGHTDGVSL